MNRRIALFLVAAATTLPAAAPNFVFILADDQAWNGLSTRMIADVPESGSDYHHGSGQARAETYESRGAGARGGVQPTKGGHRRHGSGRIP